MLPRLSLRARPLRQILILSTSLLIFIFIYRSGPVGNSSSNTSLQVNTTALLTNKHHDHENDVEHSQAESEVNVIQQSQDPKIESPVVDNPPNLSEQFIPQQTEPPKPEIQIVHTPPHFDDEYNHTEVYSVSSKDGKYLKIDFSGNGASEPSLIPHPILESTWVVVAQGLDKKEGEEEGSYEYICNAMFNDQGVLHCTMPAVLPLGSPLRPGVCPSDAGHFKISGARNSRIFYGPKTPYFTYEIHAEFICPGQNTTKYERQYVQDLRTLLYLGTKPSASDAFAQSTQLGIPAAAENMAVQNWFLFWDADNQTYVHYDIAPTRVYGKIDPLSSIVEDMSTQLPASDAQCMLEYIPSTGRGDSVSQATNSLSITTCKRFDDDCILEDSNTFIMEIFQRRSQHREIKTSEPFVILFDRNAPFATHGISTQPLWFAGQKGKAEDKEGKTSSHVEMLNIMGISWKDKTQTYHGFVDDIIHVAFGIEGKMTGVVDVVAGDLLEDLGLCSSLEIRS
jgi:hypothetical protein